MRIKSVESEMRKARLSVASFGSLREKKVESKKVYNRKKHGKAVA